ncbi:MAG: hypothetical protein HWE16_12605 [Gammaproteobacteria bacterium]|nr:hypothetical protein [Gammaproteobacteria bacterium]
MRLLFISLLLGCSISVISAEEPSYLWQKDLKISKNEAGQLQYFDKNQKALNGFYQIQLENGYIQATFQNGFFEGSFKQVENNRLKFLIDYCASKPCGVYQSYFEDGKIAKHKNYNKWGQLDGNFKVYSPNDGRLLRKTHYEKGIKSGVEVVYFDAGLESVKSRTNYAQGKKQGEETLYFQQGGLEVKQFYVNDQLAGKHIKYDEEGEKLFEANYKDGQYHGSAKMFLNGKLWILKHYQQGKLHGKWIEYDLEQKGITKQVKYFAYDKEIEQKGWTELEVRATSIEKSQDKQQQKENSEKERSQQATLEKKQ